MGRRYKDLVFTTHAEERMDLRGLDAVDVYRVWQQPERTVSLEEDKQKRIATLRDREVHIIAAPLSDEPGWLVISAWVRGEDDPVSLLEQLLCFIGGLVWRLMTFVWGEIVKVFTRK